MLTRERGQFANGTAIFGESEELDVEADKSDGRVLRPSQCQVTCCLAMRARAPQLDCHVTQATGALGGRRRWSRTCARAASMGRSA